MIRTTSALSGRLLLLGAVSLLVFFAALAAACGSDATANSPTPTADPTTPVATPGEVTTPTPGVETPTTNPQDGGGTITPTPEVNDPDGFEEALREFEKELRSGGLDAVVARALVREYLCKADDLEPGLGRPDCVREGEIIRAIEMSGWRSEGGLRKVEAFVAYMQSLQGDLRPDVSDDYGDGAPDIYAFDATKNYAVLTFVVDCQPQHQCPNGTQRGALVLRFEYEDGRWMIPSVMTAFVLYEDFLDPSEEGAMYFPAWERLD